MLLLLVAGLVRLPTLSNPLVEAHAFRQTQTAYSALLYHRDGIDLFHTPLPVLGPPWEVPFEFPLFQATAAVVMDFGVPLEPATRGVNLAFFLLTGAILWFGLRRHVDPLVATVALAFFLFSPFSLLWSRTSMIEYLATAAAVGFVVSSAEWAAGGSRRWYAVAMVAGILVALVKITTAIVWIAPAVFLFRRRWRAAIPLVVLPLLFGLAWTRYADSIKAGGEFTSGLTSSALLQFNLGTIGERLDPATWELWLWHLVPLGVIGLVGVAFLRRDDAHRGVWLWCGGAIAVAAIVVPTLYSKHTYYVAALSPAIATLLAGGFAAALERRPRKYVVGAAVLFAIVTFGFTQPVWSLAYRSADPDGELIIARQVASSTAPDDLVLVMGRDWSPAILLYADRRGIMLPAWLPAPTDTTGYRVFDCFPDNLSPEGQCRDLGQGG